MTMERGGEVRKVEHSGEQCEQGGMWTRGRTKRNEFGEKEIKV